MTNITLILPSTNHKHVTGEAAVLKNGSLARYVKLLVAHAPALPGTFSPPPRVSDPDIHHGTCVTHLPQCMLDRWITVSFDVGDRENVPGIPGASATRKFTYLVRSQWSVKQAWNIDYELNSEWIIASIDKYEILYIYICIHMPLANELTQLKFQQKLIPACKFDC